MDAQSQNKVLDRQPVAAGRFYAAEKESLRNDLSGLFRDCKKDEEESRTRAIISPHAGYVFSGKIAAAAFSVVPGNATFSNIFIIGSSHVMSFDGASVYNTGDYITPLGRAAVNTDIANKLKETRVFNFPTTAHQQEHSIEVQIPFIQYHFSNQPRIVPIIIGTQKESTIRKIAEALVPYFTSENLFVISSDFSHYPPYEQAIEADMNTAMGLASGKPASFLRAIEENKGKGFKGMQTSMCGWTSGLTLLYLSEGDSRFEYKLVDYSNSGDSKYGGKDQVVGYHAISLTEKDNEAGLAFDRSEEEQLFRIARNNIEARLNNTSASLPEQLPSKFSEKMGAFVTLKIDGSLRGCIGRFVSEDPLYKAVSASAISSAFGDPRFIPLSLSEYKKVSVEITVLGPLKRIYDINELILGKHGIYIKKDNRSGTMLPQVATENGWTKEQFLGYTARDKAGIGWDGWKEAELYIYEGLVLEENR